MEPDERKEFERLVMELKHTTKQVKRVNNALITGLVIGAVIFLVYVAIGVTILKVGR